MKVARKRLSLRREPAAGPYIRRLSLPSPSPGRGRVGRAKSRTSARPASRAYPADSPAQPGRPELLARARGHLRLPFPRVRPLSVWLQPGADQGAEQMWESGYGGVSVRERQDDDCFDGYYYAEGHEQSPARRPVPSARLQQGRKAGAPGVWMVGSSELWPVMGVEPGTSLSWQNPRGQLCTQWWHSFEIQT